MPAICLSVMGLCLPALGPAGRTAPSLYSTASSGSSHSLAARLQDSFMTSRAASTVAMPLEKVARLPPVRKL